MNLHLIAWCTSLFSFSHSSLLPAQPLDNDASALQLIKRQVTDSSCTNGQFTRACWGDGFSIATDFDLKFPTTGNTVTYNLEITNATCNPDGGPSKWCTLVNGQFPGPVIRATWGDHLVINVKNSMQHNGTSIHWHGVRQLNSAGSDGVNGITECALAPGDSKTYAFDVTQSGSSWYHSHFSSQYGNGLIGSMVFEGPATANYHTDLGPYLLTDWFHRDIFDVEQEAMANFANSLRPPPSDTILINGTNKNADGVGDGDFDRVSIRKGRKYRLRLINAAVDAFISVSLDGHAMQVIATDFIPIKPYTTETILMAMGQRYDVIITADQDPGNYWFRAISASGCFSSAVNAGRAIWTYEGVESAEPNTAAFATPDGCVEPVVADPFWVQPVPSDAFTSTVDSFSTSVTRQNLTEDGSAVTVWALNDTAISVNWGDPTVAYLLDGRTDIPTAYNTNPLLEAGLWNYYVIQQPTVGVPPIPHPIHLHGHDFFVLGTGTGIFDFATANLNFETPPRRDTATLPPAGWLAMAFPSNNPGPWLVHCHIAFHISGGLGLQFLESPDLISVPDRGEFDRICQNWRDYEKTAVWSKTDSGL